MQMPLSLRQCESIMGADARINIWAGAVRSGKTYGSILKLITLLKEGPRGPVMILGASRESIQRNVVTELCTLLGQPLPATKTNEMRMFGRPIHLIGAHDERAVSRIQGSTVAIGYVDEATVIPAPVFRMFLSRLSIPGAQLLATCNPAGPVHWLKRDFIDNPALNIKVFNFNLDDNPSLSDEYKRDLKSEYTGMWYKRYILGEWAAAEGLVFDGFEDEHITPDSPPLPTYYIAGVDYGITNPTVCLLIGVYPMWPHLCVLDEYYWDNSVAPRAKTDHELARDIKDFLGHRLMQGVYVDPSAAGLKIELERNYLPVIDANHDVIPGISTVQSLLNHRKLAVHSSCEHLIDEMRSYSWDAKASDRGEDKPVKSNDHCCDALRYALHTRFPEAELTQRNEVELTRRARQEMSFSPFAGSGSSYY